MRHDLPTGTVTFLFTDVEGSTRLLHELGAEGYAEALQAHRWVIRDACAAYGGVEVDTQGDAFFFAFPTAPGALSAAELMTEAFVSGPIQVRIGLHTGTPHLGEEGYVGGDVHRAARIAAAGHGGQVLVSASTAPLVERELRDLGEHRFKDLSAPERVYQLGEGDFPLLKSLYRTNLPVPATLFLGRERELTEVVGMLENARLLTLTGPGGTGKTRLALQAAGAVADAFPDGVYWVPLAPLRDPRLVLESASQAVGAADSLVEHLGDMRLLLLFDNFEQLIDAAADLGSVVAACPNVTLVVTSRELLRVQGEMEYAVPPLAQSEAVALFCQRAQIERSREITELCARLDNLPLAVELAASRARAFSPTQILERFSHTLDLFKGSRDADPRQQTLRATIQWSYELLTEQEQELFARLSVFAGGCTLEAAEEVCYADLDTLQSLVEKSLVRVTHERYWMLEMIREFAGERLAETGEQDGLRQRHAEHFVLLAEEAEPELRRGDARLWLDRLDAEHNNMRAALAWGAAHDSDGLDLRLSGALARFWWDRSHIDEGRRWLQAALAREGGPPEARARAFRGLGYLAWVRGDREELRTSNEEALALYRNIGDLLGTAMVSTNLGIFWREEGDPRRARPLLEEGATLHRELGEMSYLAHSLAQLGLVSLDEGDTEQAIELCSEGLALARSQKNEHITAIILEDLGFVALRGSLSSDAGAYFAEGLEIFARLDDKTSIASCLRGVAAVA
ncbi:MAG TPA: adenylate/guanylate cyclase domain-containing protein, partial [Gaiellaceae bacterium]|nr:adenylate/guanylate cyclase domain-containing protein [Gaiellaceae bacterium]